MAVVEILIHSDAFHNYRCHRTISIGINLNNMAKIFRSAANDDIITVKTSHCADFAFAIFPKQDKLSRFVMDLMDIDTKPLWFIREEEYRAIVKIPSSEFSRICNDLTSFGDSRTVAIEVTEEGVEFSTKGENGASIIVCRHDASVHKRAVEATVIEMNETVCQRFSLTMMNSFTKAMPLSNIFTISLSNLLKLSVVVEYKIAEMGHLGFYLPPMIEDRC